MPNPSKAARRESKKKRRMKVSGAGLKSMPVGPGPVRFIRETQAVTPASRKGGY